VVTSTALANLASVPLLGLGSCHLVEGVVEFVVFEVARLLESKLLAADLLVEQGWAVLGPHLNYPLDVPSLVLPLRHIVHAFLFLEALQELEVLLLQRGGLRPFVPAAREERS